MIQKMSLVIRSEEWDRKLHNLYSSTGSVRMIKLLSNLKHFAITKCNYYYIKLRVSITADTSRLKMGQ